MSSYWNLGLSIKFLRDCGRSPSLLTRLDGRNPAEENSAIEEKALDWLRAITNHPLAISTLGLVLPLGRHGPFLVTHGNPDCLQRSPLEYDQKRQTIIEWNTPIQSFLGQLSYDSASHPTEALPPLLFLLPAPSVQGTLCSTSVLKHQYVISGKTTRLKFPRNLHGSAASESLN